MAYCAAHAAQRRCVVGPFADKVVCNIARARPAVCPRIEEILRPRVRVTLIIGPDVAAGCGQALAPCVMNASAESARETLTQRCLPRRIERLLRLIHIVVYVQTWIRTQSGKAVGLVH